MSKCNWIIGTTFGLVCLAGSFPVLSQDAKSKDVTSQTEKKNQNACVASMAGSSFTLNCARQEPSGDKYEVLRNEREKLDLKAQQSVADSTRDILYWTRVQIVLSLFGVLGLGWTLRETRQSNRIAEIGHRQQTTAYPIIARPPGIYMHPSTSRPWRPNIPYSIFNSGLTPAEELFVTTKWTIREKGTILFTAYSVAPQDQGLISIGGNGGADTIDAVYEEETIPVEFIDKIRTGQAVWDIIAVLNYKTIFGPVDTSFRYISRVVYSPSGVLECPNEVDGGYAIPFERVSMNYTPTQ